MESAKLRVTRALVPYAPRALRALVSHMSRALRAPRVFVPYVPRALCALVSHVSYVLLYLVLLSCALHFLVLLVLPAVRALLLLTPYLLQVFQA